MRVSSVAVLAAILLSEATTAFVAPSKPVRLQKGSSSLQSGARSAAEVTKSNLKYLLVPNRKDVQKVPVTSPPSSSSSVPEPPVAAPEPVVVPEPVVAHAPEPPVIKVPHEIRSNSAFAHHKAEAVVIKSAAAPPVEVVSNSAFAVHKAEVITSAAAPPVNVDVDVHTVSMKEAIATMHGKYEGMLNSIHDSPRSPGEAPSMVQYVKGGDYVSPGEVLEKLKHLPSLNYDALNDMKFMDFSAIKNMNGVSFGGKMELMNLNLDKMMATVAAGNPVDKFSASFQALSTLLEKDGFTADQVVKTLNLEDLGVWYLAFIGLLAVMSSGSSSPTTQTIIVPAGTQSETESIPVTSDTAIMQGQIMQLSEATAALSKELKALKSNKAERDYEVAKMKGDLRDLQNQLDGKDIVEADLKATLSRAEKEKTTLSLEVEALKAEISLLRGETSAAPVMKSAPVKAATPKAAPKRAAKAKAAPKRAKASAPAPAPKASVPAPVPVPAPAPVKSPVKASVKAPVKKARAKAPVKAKAPVEAAPPMFFSSSVGEQVAPGETPVVKGATKKAAKKASKKAKSTVKKSAADVAPKAVAPKVATPRGASKVAAPKAKAAAPKVEAVTPKSAPKAAKASVPKAGADDWSALSPSTLKRKTVKDITDYLSSKGKSVSGSDGKVLKKADLLEVVQSL